MFNIFVSRIPLRFSNLRCREESSTPAAPWLSSTKKENINPQLHHSHLDFRPQKAEYQHFFKANSTFLLGECITGAGGEGGPLGIFLFILQQTIINVTHIHTPFAILVEYENTGINIHTNSFYPKIHSNRLLTNVNKKVFTLTEPLEDISTNFIKLFFIE